MSGGRHLRSWLPRISRLRQWSIGIYTGESPLTLRQPADLVNPVLSAGDVTDVTARSIADPFMMHTDSGWYMFFEVLDDESGLGKIGYARSDDARHWQYAGIVLQEPFHLSYPYLVTTAREVYLIPESGNAGCVRLYRARSFPTDWELVGTLLTGQPFTDSSVFPHDGRWWMFTVTDPRRNDALRLYSAERIEGLWTEHPQSPVVTGNPHLARPAGRVFGHAGHLFRYAQDALPWYGSRVWAVEVTELTIRAYAERLAVPRPIVARRRFGGWRCAWNALGMHHVDPHPWGERWIACVDGHRHVLRHPLTRG